MKLWRCQNGAHPDKHGRLIFDFWAEKPVCPECGVDGEKDGDIVVPLAMIHFNPPHAKIVGRGTGYIACSGKRVGLNGTMASGDPNAVNCQKCRDTEAWKALAAKWEEEGGEIMRQSILVHAGAFKESLKTNDENG